MRHLNAEKAASEQIDLQSAAVLAATLERLEREPGAPDPEQYRLLVTQLGRLLQMLEGHRGLRALLAHYPGAAQLYENLQYEHAGLCLQPLDRSLAAEGLTRKLLGQVATR